MTVYRFGPFILDPQERRLVREGELVPLTPKAFDLLVYLLEHQGHLAGKDEIMQALWKDSIVEEGNLSRTIHVLRRVLGNGDNDAQYIETVPTKGYRFVAQAMRTEAKAAAHELPAASVEVRAETKPEPGLLTRRALAGSAVAAALLLALVGSNWSGLGSTPPLRTLKPPTSSGAALMKFQSGRLHVERQYPGDNEAALEDFEKAIELDPGFAAAYAGKAGAKIFAFWESASHDDIVQARVAINKALELDPNSWYAHTLLCRIRAIYDWDFAGAEPECRRAVALDPNGPEARRELAFLMNSVGRKEEALREMDFAITLEPTSFNKRNRGMLLYFARRYDEAIAQLTQVDTTDPEYVGTRVLMMRCLDRKKDYARALEYLILARRSAGAGLEEIERLRRAFATGAWPAVLRATLTTPPKTNLETAEAFAQIGQKDQAFAVLDQMVQIRKPMIVHMDSDPRLDPLRSDPRFEQLVKHMGLRDTRKVASPAG